MDVYSSLTCARPCTLLITSVTLRRRACAVVPVRDIIYFYPLRYKSSLLINIILLLFAFCDNRHLFYTGAFNRCDVSTCYGYYRLPQKGHCFARPLPCLYEWNHRDIPPREGEHFCPYTIIQEHSPLKKKNCIDF